METHVLHRVGYSQENDQLLREGQRWPDLLRRFDTSDAMELRTVDEDASTAVDGGDGSDHVYGLDLRSSRPHAAAVKVAHPLMLRAIAVAKKKNDRIDARQDCRLPALRFPAGVLHGTDGDSANGGAPCVTGTCWSGRWCS